METFGVIGYPVKHSLSPVTHMAAFSALGIKASYSSFEIEPKKLPEFMRVFRKSMKGMNVTIPHKVAVMPYMDVIDEEALAMGAVNTVLNKNGKLYGYNTDSYGAVKSLHKVLGGNFENFLEDKEVTVLGSGGAARAVCFGILKHGGGITILNRHIERAIELVDHFIKIFPHSPIHFGELSDFDAKRTGILINTTPVGMIPNDAEIPLSDFKEKILKLDTKSNGKKPHRPLVMDIVYRPRFTRLIREAQEIGCPIVTGERMFLHQAVKAFEIWTNQKAPIEVMEKAIMGNLS